jgi:hypothetical protein
VVAHVVTRATCRSRSWRSSADDTRAYTTLTPVCVPVAGWSMRISGRHGSRGWGASLHGTHRYAVTGCTPFAMAHSLKFTIASYHLLWSKQLITLTPPVGVLAQASGRCLPRARDQPPMGQAPVTTEFVRPCALTLGRRSGDRGRSGAGVQNTPTPDGEYSGNTGRVCAHVGAGQPRFESYPVGKRAGQRLA